MKLKKETIGVLILVAAATSAAASGPPQILIEEAVRDLGAVAQGEILEVAFEVANRGDEPLKLSVRPTCGCTVADFDSVIPAHGKGSVRARVDTAAFAGQISKSILVLSNDPARSTINLVVRAEVRPILAVLPKALIRMDTVLGRTVTERVVVAAASPDTGAFEITEVSTGAGFLVAEFRRLEGDDLLPGRGDTQFELSISLTEDAPVGFINTPVTVYTNHPSASSVEVKVIGMVRS